MFLPLQLNYLLRPRKLVLGHQPVEHTHPDHLFRRSLDLSTVSLPSVWSWSVT
jgi:hypothetical protein